MQIVLGVPGRAGAAHIVPLGAVTVGEVAQEGGDNGEGTGQEYRRRTRKKCNRPCHDALTL